VVRCSLRGSDSGSQVSGSDGWTTTATAAATRGAWGLGIRANVPQPPWRTGQREPAGIEPSTFAVTVHDLPQLWQVIGIDASGALIRISIRYQYQVSVLVRGVQ